MNLRLMVRVRTDNDNEYGILCSSGSYYWRKVYDDATLLMPKVCWQHRRERRIRKLKISLVSLRMFALSEADERKVWSEIELCMFCSFADFLGNEQRE